jgi:hypothetical protein
MSSYTNGVSLLPLSDGSIGYQVFGVSDSLDFALAEWLGMWINANISTMNVDFLPVDQSEWVYEKKRRLQLLGIPSNDSQLVVVYSETGRYIGGATEFADLVKRNFSVVCKLPQDVLLDIAKENGRRYVVLMMIDSLHVDQISFFFFPAIFLLSHHICTLVICFHSSNGTLFVTLSQWTSTPPSAISPTTLSPTTLSPQPTTYTLSSSHNPHQAEFKQTFRFLFIAFLWVQDCSICVLKT